MLWDLSFNKNFEQKELDEYLSILNHIGEICPDFYVEVSNGNIPSVDIESISESRFEFIKNSFLCARNMEDVFLEVNKTYFLGRN